MTRVAQRESFGTSDSDHADLAFKGLRDRLLAKDEAGVTNSSFELLSSGRPFSEILSEAIATVRSAKEDANEAGQGEPRKPEITRGQDTPGADAPGHEPVSYENPPSQTTPSLQADCSDTRAHPDGRRNLDNESATRNSLRFSRRAKMGLALCGFLTGLVGLEFYRSALGDHRTEWGPDVTVVASFSTASPEIAVGKIADPSDGVTSLDSGVGNPTATGGMSDVKPTVDETVTVAETVAPPSGAPELTVAALSSEQVPASPPSKPSKEDGRRENSVITEATAIKMTEPLAVNPAGQKQPDADASAFITRGDELFARGDFSAARLFYQRAADRGDATAAVRMGGTYDPRLLAQARFKSEKGNWFEAARWYERAHQLGAPEGQVLLNGIPAPDEGRRQ